MSDSIGKISLDLEVTSDLSKQISIMSNAMGKKLKETMDTATKSMFDGMGKGMNNSMQSINTSLKTGLGKMKETIKNTLASAFETAKTIKMPTIKFPKINITKPTTNNAVSQPTTRGPPTIGINTEAIKAQMDNVAKTLDNTNAKIEQQQSKLAALKEEYASAFNQERKNKLEEQILKTEASINKLIGTSDRLGFKLSELDEEFAGTATGAKTAEKEINNLGNKTKSFSNNVNKSNGPTKGLFNSLKNLGSSSKTAGNHISNSNGQIKMIVRSMLTWGIIFPIVLKGLQSMGSSLLASLNTNKQFANSLAQIKTNLMVAFTPIFYAILPAINALMSAIATATTYIASFISSIFGKTYQQSYQATQGLVDAKEAMGAYGDTAKKAGKDSKGALAGFDEINQLDTSKNDGDSASGGAGKSKVPSLVQPNINTSAVDGKMKALTDKIKAVMAQIFVPFQQAWAAQGQNTINSIHYALNSIKKLLEDIGQSFMKVWTNGTGTQILTLLLQILQNIFNIIGDIAAAFTTAWNKGGLGTSIVQSIGNALENILTVIKHIGDSFRTVWNNGTGITICTTMLSILKSIFDIIGKVALSFANAWNGGNAGTKIIQGLASAVSNVLSFIKGIGTSIQNVLGEVAPSVTKSFMKILDSVIDVLKDLTQQSYYVWDNGGQHCFEGLIKLGAKILEIAANFIEDFIAPVTKGLLNTVSPAIGKILDVVGGLCDYLAGDGSSITKTFLALYTGFKATGFVIEVGKATAAIIASTVAKLKDKVETIALIALYAKDFVVALAKGTAEIMKQVVQWGVITAAKLKDKIESLALIAVYVKDFVVAMAKGTLEIIKQIAQLGLLTAAKVLDTLKTGLLTAASTTLKIAQAALNLIMSMNPISLVVTAIAALVAIFITAYEKCDWFRNGVNNAFNGIKAAANSLKQVFSNVFGSLWGIVKWPLNQIIGGVNTLIAGLNNIHFDMPDWSPVAAGKSFGINIPKVPCLAKGGVVDSPTLSMIGEAGKEAVVPLENNTGWMDKVGEVVANAVIGAMQFASGNDNSNQQPQGDTILQIDGTTLARILSPYVQKENQRMGKNMIIKTV